MAGTPGPSLSTSSVAASEAKSSGMTTTPWYQGDFVVSMAGDATSGNRTAPVGGGGITPMHLAVGAVVLIVGVLLWRRFK